MNYRFVKDYRYTDLDKGSANFNLRDQKGRAVGYKWNIYRVNVELMSDDEVAASKGFHRVYSTDKPLDFIEVWTTTTRDGVAYGPSTKNIAVETIQQAHDAATKRAAAAYKQNVKKFAREVA